MKPGFSRPGLRPVSGLSTTGPWALPSGQPAPRRAPACGSLGFQNPFHLSSPVQGLPLVGALHVVEETSTSRVLSGRWAPLLRAFRVSSREEGCSWKDSAPQPPFSSECVVEAEGRRVADGESWRDPSNACIACTCHVSWG